MSKRLKLEKLAAPSPRRLRSKNKNSIQNPVNAKTSEFFEVNTESENLNTPVEKKKSKTKNNQIINESNKTVLAVSDDQKENKKSQWFPENWQKTLDNIREMRKSKTAPVDDMGCHKCGDELAIPSVYRFQNLLALMLSSQTKDQVTHAAMQRLKEATCTPENMLHLSSEELEKIIYPVSFYKVICFKSILLIISYWQIYICL